MQPDGQRTSSIAIIGMAGRFPGARNLDEFWQNLRDGTESIRVLSDEELEARGVEAALRSDPNYVRAAAVLDDAEWFDAAFFGYTPRDAEVMDPQHRLFLECAWEALESAGYQAEEYRGTVGVFAGTQMSTYLVHNLVANRQILDEIDPVQLTVGNDESFLATRVSYNLNLMGPSCAVQSACSTALVAVHLACQSLLNGECDIALAGGVCVNFGNSAGYYYQEGGMSSPDGHCRAFDARAGGTVFGSGLGIVAMRCLDNAIADGDHVRAVIRGSAVNNDGSAKVGYTAPGVGGQTAVIAEALTVAEVDADTISYIETHGTGTKMGDPIEIEAMTEAFRAGTGRKNCCAIGSVKTNVGHLGTAAGAAGLIKTVLALEHEQIPASLHFEEPNPKSNLADSPFFVNTELTEWQSDGGLRCAGVSAFGLGGTNVHIILEQAPATREHEPSRAHQLLLLSAKTDTALEANTANLLNHLRENPDICLADVAYTLQKGRQAFQQRRMAVCGDRDGAVDLLETCDPDRVLTSVCEYQNRPVAFLFPGMGDQYVDMALGLYQAEPTFREQIDRCAEFLGPLLNLDVRDVLYPHGTQPGESGSVTSTSDAPVEGIDLRKLLHRGEEPPDGATQRLSETHLGHPILFTVEYALAKLWMEWGVRPEAMIGHSLGEYVAACLAGVISLEDALLLITRRAQMIQELAGGAMLAVLLSEEQVQPLLDERLSLSAVNAPLSCVVSGPVDAVDDLEQRILDQRTACQRLPTTHAFHSSMMVPIAQAFKDLVAQVMLHPPEIPYLSNVTGDWITPDQATDASYWSTHLCQTVRFAEGMQHLLARPELILLEVGPGLTLSTLATQHADKKSERVILTTLRHPHDPQPDTAFLLTALGRLWLAGSRVDWTGFYAHERRHRLPLPTYPFERQRYWIEAKAPGDVTRGRQVRGKRTRIADWFYSPTWRQAPSLSPVAPGDWPLRWLVFAGEQGLGTALVERLRATNRPVVTVAAAAAFERLSDEAYSLDPENPEDYDTLIQHLAAGERLPDVVAHLWTITGPDVPSDPAFFDRMQDLGYYSLLFLAQALAEQAPKHAAHVGVVADELYEVSGNDGICPEKATLLGLCKVIPQEQRQLSCTCIDVALPRAGSRQEQELVDCLIAELAAESREVAVAYRAKKRWIRQYTPAPLREDDTPRRSLREKGVYWIVGGLGNIGYLVGQHLARMAKARLVLSGRSALPPRSRWAKILAEGGDGAEAIKIRRVQALEKLGAEVMVEQADVADGEQVNDLVARIYERFGRLDGVLHAAGVTTGPSLHKPLTETGRAESETQFHAKVQGLYALEQALAGREIDFCLLFSSSSAILGGLGFATYASTNSFLDGFAVSRCPAGPIPWISADWDPWPIAEATEQSTQTSFDRYTMTPEECQEAVRRVICLAGEGQVLVMTGDLEARLDLWVRQTASRRENGTTLHARPSHAREYVAPRNEEEQTVANIWSGILGIEQIGIHDNFFELGGHSLLLTQVLSDLRQAFGIEVPVRSLFEHTTVGRLARFIKDGGGQASGAEEKPISERIRTAFPTERKGLIKTYLEKKIALALGIETSGLSQDGSLAGFDSGMYAIDLMVHLKQDFKVQLFPQEIHRIPSIKAMADLVVTELDRVSDLSRLATANPLSAYTLQPYRKQSPGPVVVPARKNEPMVLVACSPRSGSTLLRVMLAGHPALFCPPELYLLHFETMQEWQQNVGFGDILAWNRQGLEWAFGELMGSDAQESQAYVDEMVEQDRTVCDVYRHLQELGEGRLVVDKTPTYALDTQALERAERLFQTPKYVHLVRHPYTVIESFLRVRLDKLLGPNLFKESDVDPYIVAETVWALSNRTLHEFLAHIEPERQHVVRYEDLVSDPTAVMTGLCQFLEISFDEAVLHPYDNPLGRMAGGIGDPNIFRHERINPERGEAWKTVKLPRYLDETTKRLALQFGYDLFGDTEQSGGESLPSGPGRQSAEQAPFDTTDLSDEEVDRMLKKLLEKADRPNA